MPKSYVFLQASQPLMELSTTAFYDSFTPEESWITSSGKYSSIQAIQKIIRILYLLWFRLWIRFLFSDVRSYLTKSSQTILWQRADERENYTLGTRMACWECLAEVWDLVYYCCSQSFSFYMRDGYKMADKMNPGLRAFSIFLKNPNRLDLQSGFCVWYECFLKRGLVSR